MSDKPVPPDDVFIADVTRVLDETVDRMNPWQAGRLQRVRREALGAYAGPRWNWTRWGAGIAAASIGLLALLFVLSDINRERQSPPILEDLDLVTSSENVDLSEDWEFYNWLSDSDASVEPS